MEKIFPYLEIESDTPVNLELLESITQALPRGFDFYGLGQVQSVDTHFEETFLDPTAIAYQFTGDCSAWLILLFESHLDVSMYSEVGNILASQTANQLQKEEGIGVITSPPLYLSPSQISSIKRRSRDRMIQRVYRLLSKEGEIPIQLMIFAHPKEETGHA